MGSSGLSPVRSAAAGTARPVRYAPPAISPVVLRWFLRYAEFYVRRHMHSVRVGHEQNLSGVCGGPLLLYMNHPSWWDPMIAAVLAARYLPGYAHYSPIDAGALEKYRFFNKLGFFGMSRDSFESKRKLLDIAAQVLTSGRSALWITPQSRFADVRDRPLRLGNGLPHLVRNAPECAVLPIALEYTFWEESKPEVLVRFGKPSRAKELNNHANAAEYLEHALEQTMDELRKAAVRRDSSEFRVILAGQSGVGGVYDVWRRCKALLRGEKFQPEHGGPQA